MRKFLLLLPVLVLTACDPGGGSQGGASSSSSSLSSAPDAVVADISIDQPVAGATVTSPLVVTGEARGNWYFEAVFPVHLLDANGVEIASAPAQALSDWMTTDFVPYKATLTFSMPATATGTLVLENDNPSGLPENSKSVSLPVSF
jgi:hypothetical protein